MNWISSRVLGSVTGIAVAVLALSACGASPDTRTEGEGSSTAKAVDLESLWAGTNEDPPTSAPKLDKKPNVWVISCADATEGCDAMADGAMAGGKALGWTMKRFDGNFGIGDAYNGGVRQAIAAKADAIILGGIDCPGAKAGLTEAKAAGIPVIDFLSIGCQDPQAGGGEKLTTSVELNAAYPSYPDWETAWGAARADAVIAGTDGKANALTLGASDYFADHYWVKGFNDELKAKCPSCKTENLKFQIADFANGNLTTAFSSKFSSDPTINAVVVPYDSTFQAAGVAQTIVQSGRNDDIYSLGAEGNEPNLDLIRTDRGQDAAMSFSDLWAGWGAIDTTLRLLAGEEPVPQGIGWRLIDSKHNLPDSGKAKPPVDYESKYKAAWGVS